MTIGKEDETKWQPADVIRLAALIGAVMMCESGSENNFVVLWTDSVLTRELNE